MYHINNILRIIIQINLTLNLKLLIDELKNT